LASSHHDLEGSRLSVDVCILWKSDSNFKLRFEREGEPVGWDTTITHHFIVEKER